jgi:hypothetical protein
VQSDFSKTPHWEFRMDDISIGRLYGSASFVPVNQKQTVMKTNFFRLILLSLLIQISVFSHAQQVISDTTTPYIEPLSLDGPRIGFSFANGYNLNALREFMGDSTFTIDPFLSLFGWQFEWRYFQTANGDAGLIEFIPMIAGLDQGLILPSANILVGYRTKNGFEIGCGPNFSLAGGGMVFAVGNNFTNGHVNFPINLAVIRGKDSIRMALTFGFNKRSR